MKKNIYISAVVLVVIVSIYIFYIANNTPFSCGGYTKSICSSGLTCVVKESYPDALGRCYPLGIHLLFKIF